ncbi:MAG: T9SS type A sorting domain-containing protein [Bacteroidota bacterium]
MKKLILVNLCFVLFVCGAIAQDGKFTFTLPAATSTSAGVFKNDSILVRTLWSNEKYAAGTHTAFWNGEDDFGKDITNASTHYSIKIMSSNVKYQWQGIIGNSSKAQTGSSVHRGYYHCMRGLVFTNGFGYYCRGYAEGAPSLAKFPISDPQTKIDFVNTLQPGDINYVATDDINVYWGGFDASATSGSFVYASKVSNDADVDFPSGQVFAVTFGKVYNKAISVSFQSNSLITGLAVQKAGNFLFVARAGLNQLQVLNKTSGALVKTLNYTSPKSLAVDKAGNLWMHTGLNTVAKYTVSSDGSLSSPVLQLAGLVKPAALQVTTDGTQISVADDSTSQQVRWFDNNSGALVSSFGTPGGYVNDPTVANDKFYFNDLRSKSLTFIAYQPDGTFWVGDPGNYRAQHYTAAKTFINRIQSLGATYNTGVDKNDIKRVFSDNMEFAIDYSVQNLTGSTGWNLVKNWNANTTSNYHKFPKFQTTMSNGKTYGLIRNVHNTEVVEYPDNGPMRFTGKKFFQLSVILCADGSILDCEMTSTSCTYKRYEFLGFDAIDNPQWSTTGEILAITPTSTTGNPACFPKTEVLTSTNKVVFFNHKAWASSTGPVVTTGYHMGIMPRGANNKWLAQTEQSTFKNYGGEYPPAGYFDVGNGVNDFAGGSANVVDRNIFTSYHGEFWKNGQTNMYNHYWDNGLSVGQFGTTRPRTTGEAAAMMAGNALTPEIVKDANGDYYLYHGDESDHAGIHRWKITGLNTISEQVVELAPPDTYKDNIGYVDLMKDLPFDAIMPTNVGGWVRFPTTNNVVNKYYDAFTSFTGRQTVDRASSPDVLINFVKPTTETYYVSRTLGSNNVANSWKISGEIAYPNNMPNGNTSGQYLEVLDNNGKVLTRFFPELNRQVNPFVATVYGNTKAMTQGTEGGIRRAMEDLHPFEVKIINGVVTFTYDNYAPVSTSIFDATGNWKAPATLRAIFFSKTSSLIYQTVIDLKNFKFYKDYLPVPGVNSIPEANAGNDKLVVLPAVTSTTLNGSAKDPDGIIVGYSWTKISGPAGGNIGSPSSASTSITNVVNGIYRYQLKVTDDKGRTSVDTAQVDVVTLNKAPVINAGADITITFPTLITTLNGTATDADGTITSISWKQVSGATGSLLALPTTLISGLSALLPGIYQYQLTVTDEDGAIARDTVKVTVNLSPYNKVPVVNAGSDKVMTLPTNGTTITGTASDPDGSIKSYQWAKISGPSLGTIASPKTASTIIYNLAMGVYLFELTVMDNSYATKKDTLKVTVNKGSVNMIPTVNAGPDKYVELPGNTTNLGGYGQDLDGTITYKWTKLTGPSTFYISSPNSANTAVQNLVEGSYLFELRVTDNSGAIAKDSLIIKVYTSTSSSIVAPTNQLPVVNAGINQVIDLPTNTVTLKATASDGDGTIAKYVWTMNAGPRLYSIQSPNSASTVVSGLEQGTYQFIVTVTDNSGGVTKDDVQVVVNGGGTTGNTLDPVLGNVTPVANAGADKTVILPSTSVTLTGIGTDSDGTIASYSWARASGSNSFLINSPNSATTVISNLIEGSYIFQFKVIDDRGASAYDWVTVVVKKGTTTTTTTTTVAKPATGNVGPVANGGADAIVYLPATSVTLKGTGTDSDGTIASYSWARASGSNYFLINSPKSATTTISNLVEGTYIFQFKVIDNSGASAYDWVTVTVKKGTTIVSSEAATSETIPGTGPALSAIGTQARSNDFKVYPNPVKDVANLDISSVNGTGKISVSVLNMAGMQVMTKETRATGQKTVYQVDMTNLKNGTYVIILRFEDGSIINKKVIKEGTR